MIGFLLVLELQIVELGLSWKGMACAMSSLM